MSADNFVGVRPNPDELTYSIFGYGCMSILDEDCMYLATERGEEIAALTMAEARATALVKAHDIVKEMDICEYGVVELPPISDEPCGRCYVCVHDRKIVADDVQRCTKCNEPISTSEWMTMTSEGTFHSSCEPR